MFVLNDFLGDLEKLINIDSNSFYPDGLREIVSAVEKIALDMGLYVKRHFLDKNCGDYLEVTNKPNADHYDVMLMGHLDTVQPVGSAKERPFSKDDTYIYGPGVTDMKSGALCALYAVKELDVHTKNKLNIVLIFNPDEERSSIFSKPITAEIAKKSDYSFVLEQPSDLGTYTIARKGSGTFKFMFYGIPGHSGYIFDVHTANAAVEMAHWAVEMHKLIDKDNLFSVNIGIINGGKVSNVVPDYAEMTVNIRVTKKEQYDIFYNKIKELTENPFIPDVKVEYETISKCLPMIPVPQMDEYLVRVRKTFEKIGQKFELYPMRGGASDGNTIASVGTRCIDSLGPCGSGVHTPNEKVLISDIEPAVIRIKALMEEIAEHKK